MANELSIRVQLSFSKGGAKVSRNISKSITVTGDAFTSGVQSIGTASEEILYQGAELGTLGYVFIINLDATNYIQVGITGQYSIRVRAGEFALFRADADIYAKANTGACLVEYVLIED